MSDNFKPPPFNYCDYRCEQCDERDHCRVYKDNAERILNHYTKGEDPYDPDILFKDLNEIFQKTKNMLEEMAEREGIDLKDAATEETPEVNPDDYRIYRLAYQYFEESNKFIKELQATGIPETITDEFQDLSWYHTLIAAKAGRLVSGFIDDFDEEIQKIEEEGTLKVINKGIMLSQNALHNMLNELPDHLSTIAHLIELLKTLEHQIHTNIYEKVD
jgi:hypothetical protein